MEHSTSKKRVVITGIGVVTSLGHDIGQFWENLLAGKSGITRVTRFDSSAFTCKVAAEVTDFNAENYMDAKEVKRNDRYTVFAVSAAKIAVNDSQLDINKVDKDRVGVVVGSGIGGMETIETQAKVLFEKGPRRVSPFMIPSLIGNAAPGIIAIELGCRGPNFSIVTACATGSHCIGEAFKVIQRGDADIMIAGGSEAAITQLGFSGFCSMKAMSTDFNDTPQKACRPFDAKRDGFVMGEGAGILILETLEHAIARGAKIYCELAGYAANCDAYHITSPHPEGRDLANCLEAAIRDASVSKESIGYINAHGTSTPYNDKFETMAYKKVFGEHARKLKISSTKSMTGHLLGATGAVEAAVCAKVIETGEIPPTINYENPDPDCDLDYVPNVKTSAPIEVALSDNLGFGGHNAALVFKKYR